MRAGRRTLVDGEQEREFRTFVAARQSALLRSAYLLTGDLASAEDLLQVSLTKTYLAWPRIKDKAMVERYVRTTMSRTSISWWRRRWVGERATAVLPEVAVNDRNLFDDRDEVWRALLTLPTRQRTVLVLRFYEELSEAEIADVLGCSTGSVKTHASRGIRAMRDRLGDGDTVNGASR
jgi:RNA polymerase sigma-70 factor (sigma-E family)